MDEARLDSPDASDILVSLRWTAETNQAGIAGMLISDASVCGKSAAGCGNGIHSSPSPFDLRATLIAAGPDLPRVTTNQFSTGNADLAPTILSLLGNIPPRPMYCRILTQNFGKPVPGTLKAANGNWRQYLHMTELGSAFYIEEGNGPSQVIHSEETRVSH